MTVTAAAPPASQLFAGKTSFGDNFWDYQPPATPPSLLPLADGEALPTFLQEFFTRRGLDADEIAHYLKPRLKNLLPDPYDFTDMAKAAARIARAVQTRETIGLYSDYDVDGGCSAALFANYFAALDVRFHLYVPSRLDEGYGVHPKGLQALHNQGASLIICSDCGTGMTAETARSVPSDIVILDHHQTTAAPPEVFAFVNPMRNDDQSGHKDLCAAAICFLGLIAVNRILRKSDDSPPLPDLLEMLDLVALAVIADVMPLTGLNRALVTQGIKMMNRKSNLGLDVLNRAVRQHKDITHSEHISFGLAPYLNAAGRMGESLLAAQLLSATTVEDAEHYVQRLQKLNNARIEQQNQCLKIIDRMMTESPDIHRVRENFLLFAAPDLHIGITGIAAGRIKDKHHLPCLVVSYDKSGIGTGSARSVRGIDIGALLKRAHDDGILLRAGGHAMAGGFTLERGKESLLRDFLRENLHTHDNLEQPEANRIVIDSVCNVPDFSSQQIEWLAALSPFGTGNLEPIFAVPYLKLTYCRWVGKKQNHLMVTCQNPAGESLRGILFQADNHLGQAMVGCHERGARVHLAGFLRVNDYQGRRSIDITIRDVMAADAL